MRPYNPSISTTGRRLLPFHLPFFLTRPQYLSIWAVLKPIHHLILLLILMLKASRILPRPLLHLFPIPAHPDLALAGPRWILEPRIPRCIIGMAHNILSQLIQTVQDVYEGDALRTLVVVVHYATVDGALGG
jgi:hypothetical protein